MTGPTKPRRTDPGRLASAAFAVGCGFATALFLTGNYWGAAALTALTIWTAYGLIDLNRR